MATYYVRNDGNNANTGLGSGTTILDPILNSVGRWTLEGNTLTLYNADGTYLRRCNLSQLGLSLSPT